MRDNFYTALFHLNMQIIKLFIIIFLNTDMFQTCSDEICTCKNKAVKKCRYINVKIFKYISHCIFLHLLSIFLLHRKIPHVLKFSSCVYYSSERYVKRLPSGNDKFCFWQNLGYFQTKFVVKLLFSSFVHIVAKSPNFLIRLLPKGNICFS